MPFHTGITLNQYCFQNNTLEGINVLYELLKKKFAQKKQQKNTHKQKKHVQ